jgi:hypothetical protein
LRALSDPDFGTKSERRDQGTNAELVACLPEAEGLYFELIEASTRVTFADDMVQVAAGR